MRVLRMLCLLGAVLAAVPGAEAVEKGRSGIGVFGSMEVPLFTFADWYSSSPKVGLMYNYVASPRVVVEVEYHYASMRGGDLDERKFTWSVDKQSYASPDVSQSMWFNSLSANSLVHLKPLTNRGAIPYLMGGLGFYGFSHEVSGLVFPGQTGNAIDPSLKLNPYEDKWAALTFSMGGGVSLVRSAQFLLDVRARYNLILGEIRPLEDWGLKKAFPLQAIDLAVGFKYFW